MEATAAEQIEAALTRRMIEVLGGDTHALILDMTNFATFIDSGNDREPIAQRGKAKQKRYDLRIVDLGLVATRAGLSLPVPALLAELDGIGETVLLYQGERGRPRARHTITKMTPTQRPCWCSRDGSAPCFLSTVTCSTRLRADLPVSPGTARRITTMRMAVLVCSLRWPRCAVLHAAVVTARR